MPNLLRIPRVDGSEENSFVLVHILKQGSRTFDLKLIGTDNENVFAISLTNAKTKKLKDQQSNLSQEQWEKALSVYLLGEGGEKEDFLVGVELVAVVEEAVSTKIIIRKRVEGITQTLGSIVLPVNENETENVDLFEWCGVALQSKDTSDRELEGSKATIQSKDDEIKALTDSLAELVRLKTDNEAQLLEKFALLLNEKKLKIRDQQRLLACSHVDPAKLAEVEASRASATLRSPGPSRKGKRKAGENDESEESDNGFEKMEVDERPADNSDEEQAQTPEDTGDEGSDDEDSKSAPASRPVSNGKGKEPANIASGQPGPSTAALPPKRDLPFGRKPATRSDPEPPASASRSAPAVEGSETESDDDEL